MTRRVETTEGPSYPEPLHIGDTAAEVLDVARQVDNSRGTPARRRRGRPTRLHPQLQERICDSIRVGNFVETACVANGVSKAVFYVWQKKGRDAKALLMAGLDIDPADRAYVEFLDASEGARAEWENRFVETHARLALGGEVISVTEHYGEDEVVVGRTIKFARPDRQALEWHLVKGLPATWGKNQIEVTGPDGQPIPIEVEVSARDTLKAMLDQVSKRVGGPPAESP